MLNGKQKFCVAILMTISFMGLQAQSIINIKESSSNSSFYSNEIRKLTFSDGNLNIIANDNTSNTFVLSDIKRMDFSDITTDIQPSQEKQQIEKTQLYPNPASDNLYIKGNFANDCELKVVILNLHGKIVKTEFLQSTNSISISDLIKGMYICRIYTCDKIENIKFLKN